MPDTFFQRPRGFRGCALRRTVDLANLFDGGTKEAAHHGAVEIVVIVDSEMPNQFAGAFQNAFGDRQEVRRG